ncbi:MAG: polysaccharide biosynthesis tyrosine autokinase [Hyphomicrobiales bacterium]|nr:polysaccharide biosynthesis tyrosine autokinase [Hyphomicrobiales bacterium]
MQRSSRTQSAHDPLPLSRQPGESAAYDNGAPGVAGLLDIVRWRSGWIVGAVLVALAAASLYLVLTPRQYTATAQLLLETQQPNVVGTRTVLPGIGPDAPLIESQVEIIRSARIAGRAIAERDLAEGLRSDDSWDPVSAIVQAVQDLRSRLTRSLPPGGGEAAADGATQETQERVRKFLSRLDVQRKGLTYIVLVHYTDTDRARAARAANAVVDSYIAYQLEVRRSATETANNWLKDRIDGLRTDVLKAEERVQRFKTQHNLAAIGGQTLSEREIAETANQLVIARANAARARARLGQIETLADEPDRLTTLGEALQSGVIKEFRAQFATVRRKLATVVSRYGEESQQAEAVRAELADIRREIRAEIDRIVQKSRNDNEVARRGVALLETQLEKIKVQFADRAKLSVELAELQREAESTRKLYLSYLTRLKETEAQVSLLTPDARVVTKAMPPLVPSGPRKGLTLGLALVAGLAIGMGAAVLREQLKPMLRRPREIELVESLTHLASLPHVGARNPLVNVRAQPSSRPYRRRLEALESQTSQYAQSIFSITNAIKPPGRTGSSGTLVAIVSARAGEGKSTLAIGLASYAALSKRKVLLIDADLRKPTLTASLRRGPGTTLADIVAGGAEPSDVLVSTSPEGLAFCPAPGKGDGKRPAELLASTEMSEFLGAMRRDYDLVILDTSALIPYVDAQALAGQADVVLCVVEWGKTSQADLHAAVRRARIAEDLPVYAILNKDRSA